MSALAERLEQLGGGSPGTGPGSAPLTFGNEAPDRSDAFAPRRLTPAGLRDLEHSHVLGVREVAPDVAPEGEAAGSDEFGRGGTQSGERRRLAPKHRKAVERFFAPAGG